MKNNVLIYTMEEFDGICDRAFNGEARIENESGEWFWVMSENILDEDIKNMLEIEIRKDIVGFELDEIYVDLTKYVVIISFYSIYE